MANKGNALTDYSLKNALDVTERVTIEQFQQIMIKYGNREGSKLQVVCAVFYEFTLNLSAFLCGCGQTFAKT